jgi:four helix bundle protein
MAKNWIVLHKNTIGYQLIRSSDSIAANISEGYGRFHYKEQRHFCYIARGSLYGTNTWLVKASKRMESDNNQIEELLKLVYILLKKLNAYINYIERKNR